MTVKTISQTDAGTVLEINGEYRVRVRHRDGISWVYVSMARTRTISDEASTDLEQVARRRGALVRVEPMIDGSMVVVHDDRWSDVLDELSQRRRWPGQAEELSIDSAHDAVLRRLRANGGELPWDEAVSETMEAESFPLGYRGRDAIQALLAAQVLEKTPHPGAPRLRIRYRATPSAG